ncbi:Hypothetical protein IALB_3113 [Ignavibacterium album JCM 16511]|uniref:DUF4395 domain-containing protein n=1 Tax=Ignavibacterium album (strain DSM 19864 / JCM 16511 / NBRC 101810 / Mat9-16) TaxID=945713 RepID=I0APA9_IGNAJ|nr:DUF4395 domain-containing protein [Ignavibacterium album]AFH50816.1 Hypothetical protein IALB_3113 [Ignavibacterium album JCM 16511]
MGNVFKFGEDVVGYNIRVLNEREIRAGAGLLFVLMFISILSAIMQGNFILLKYSIMIFLADMLIRVLISPRYSPVLILGRFIVRNQVPEYVGAVQKKFAWVIGIALGITMFVLINIMNTFSVITGLICLICLIFLFFETAFGICLGCKVYSWLYKEKAQYCPGEVCEIKDRQEIQRTSLPQWIVVIAFVVYIFGLVYFLNDNFKTPPRELFSGKSLEEMQQE